MVRALGIETATSIASVGIVVAAGMGRRPSSETYQVAAERALPMRGSHARTLLPLIDAALADAGLDVRDLDLLAVSIGPGSFTGFRIGPSVAKVLALATGLPIISSRTGSNATAMTVPPCMNTRWPDGRYRAPSP